MDLKDLYQDIILDHNRAPRNFGILEPHSHEAEGYNPLCGDQLTIYLMLDGDRITDVKFEGTGCAISVASASLMTEQIIGMSKQDAEKLFTSMHEMFVDDDVEPDLSQLGKLGALAGVKEYPSRVKCASLCWHTLKAALENKQTVTTE